MVCERELTARAEVVLVTVDADGRAVPVACTRPAYWRTRVTRETRASEKTRNVAEAVAQSVTAYWLELAVNRCRNPAFLI